VRTVLRLWPCWRSVAGTLARWACAPCSLPLAPPRAALGARWRSRPMSRLSCSRRRCPRVMSSSLGCRRGAADADRLRAEAHHLVDRAPARACIWAVLWSSAPRIAPFDLRHPRRLPENRLVYPGLGPRPRVGGLDCLLSWCGMRPSWLQQLEATVKLFLLPALRVLRLQGRSSGPFADDLRLQVVAGDGPHYPSRAPLRSDLVLELVRGQLELVPLQLRRAGRTLATFRETPRRTFVSKYRAGL